MKKNSIHIKSRRLWTDLVKTARFGAFGSTGLQRLALREDDRTVRDWFMKECQSLGCTIDVDQIGNIFATYPGTDATLPPIALGSHLDTQPAGGRFDGVLGVLAGIEVIRAIRDARMQPTHPITIVNWTNEEGSRFPPALMGSGVFCGEHSMEAISGTRDKYGVSVAEALKAIGYAGSCTPGHLQFAAYLELHIEQGPVLENEDAQIGVVSGVQGISWLDVTVSGVDAHAGSRPMNLRKDALIAAAEITLAVEATANAYAPGVATVGCMEIEPNSRNVIPGRVRQEIDLRHPSNYLLTAMEEEITAEIARIAPDADVRQIWRKAPVTFDQRLVDIIDAEAKALGLSTLRLVSGAGHDAANLARLVPSAMIFIPSYLGLSHNILEYSSPEQCADGTAVLLKTVLKLDQVLQDPYQFAWGEIDSGDQIKLAADQARTHANE